MTFELRHLLAVFEGLSSTSSRFVTVELRHLLAAFEGLSSSLRVRISSTSSFRHLLAASSSI